MTEAVRGVVAMHSSDPLTPYLGAWARVPELSIEDVDRALAVERSLWRLHAMRRTLFVVPSDEAAIFDGAASRDVAKKERARAEAWIAPELPKKRAPARWLADLEAKVMEALAEEELDTRALSKRIPALGTEVTLGSGKWSQRVPIASRLLFLMAMDLRVVRTRSASWRSSQYGWAETARWFGAVPERLDPEPARMELARRYLATHGPATENDLRWWTGWTAKHARAALAALDAEVVTLASGGEGYVLPGDAEPEKARAHVSLLPGLDSTPMGWKEREWFLGPHARALFDTNGNVGPTVWLDGRIVGGWAQRPDGEVVVELLEKVSKRDRERIEAERASLGEWMGGTVVTPRFRTPLERELSAG